MPNHILVEDILDDMLETIKYIEVKTHLKLNNK